MNKGDFNKRLSNAMKNIKEIPLVEFYTKGLKEDMSKKQLYTTNFYLDRLEVEIMDLMREDINNPKIPALIAEREAIKVRLYELSKKVYDTT